jgi:D-alanyl-D-alanine carboxypeptidase
VTVYQVDTKPAAANTAASPDYIASVLKKAGIPDTISTNIIRDDNRSSFMMDLLAVLAEDPTLRQLVDKAHPLPDAEHFVPPDLVTLPREGAAYMVSKKNIQLRKLAEDALQTMALAAKGDGVTLLVSSAYRSYQYQVTVYNREVKDYGQAVADSESARPGNSQHQTGLAIDFGSISNDFAQTKAGIWMAEHAADYGWSLSFPDGYEKVTGYRWESWHYRYVGKTLAKFIADYFNGIQQYALEFINEWESEGQGPEVSK